MLHELNHLCHVSIMDRAVALFLVSEEGAIYVSTSPAIISTPCEILQTRVPACVRLSHVLHDSKKVL